MGDAVLWSRRARVLSVLFGLVVAVAMSLNERAGAAPLGARPEANALPSATSDGADWFWLVAVGMAVVAAGVAFGLVAASSARLRRLSQS